MLGRFFHLYGRFNGLILLLLSLYVLIRGGIFVAAMLGYSMAIEARPASLLEQLDIIRLSASFQLSYLPWIAAVLLLNGLRGVTRVIWVVLAILFGVLFGGWQNVANVYSWLSGAPMFYKFAEHLLRLSGLDFLNSTMRFVLVPILLSTGYFAMLFGQWLILRRQGFVLRLRLFHSLALLSLVGLVLAVLPSWQDRIPRDVAGAGVIAGVRTAFFPRHDVFELDPDARFNPVSARAPVGPAMNLVMIVLESTRWDSLSVNHPYPLATTPHLDALYPESVVVQNAYASISYTSKAMTSILCGVHPFIGMPVFENLYPSPVDCLPRILEKGGWQTVYFQSPTGKFENRFALVDKIGFDEHFMHEQLDHRGFELVNYLGFEDDILLGPSRKWLQKNAAKPFFAVYLTGTSHHPYNVPDNFETHRFVEDEEFNNYLNTIHYLDAFVGKLIQQYKDLGLYDNTVFVILGDHGEGFGEHAARAHGYVAYDEIARIPFIIHAPALLKPELKTKTFGQIDIPPTLLDILGFSDLQGFDGQSLFHDGDGLVHYSCLMRTICLAVINQQYKYIYHFDGKSDDLFNLRNDRHERHDIADQQPELTAKMRKEAIRWYSHTISRYHNYYSGFDKNFLARAKDTFDPGELDDLLGHYLRKEVTKEVTRQD